MNCDELELEVLTQGERSDEARRHLSGCDACRTFEQQSAQVLLDAQLPEPTEEERRRWQSLAPATLKAWNSKGSRSSATRQVLSLAAAACLGGVVASAAWWPRVAMTTPAPQPSPVAEWTVPFGPEQSAAIEFEDELAPFEVSWPSP